MSAGRPCSAGPGSGCASGRVGRPWQWVRRAAVLAGPGSGCAGGRVGRPWPYVCRAAVFASTEQIRNVARDRGRGGVPRTLSFGRLERQAVLRHGRPLLRQLRGESVRSRRTLSPASVDPERQGPSPGGGRARLEAAAIAVRPRRDGGLAQGRRKSPSLPCPHEARDHIPILGRTSSAPLRDVPVTLRSRLGAELRAARQDAGLSLSGLARLCGIAKSTLHAIEAGQTEPRLETAARLATALGSDLGLRLYPGTGPLVRDHLQLAMLQALLDVLHPRWAHVRRYRCTSRFAGSSISSSTMARRSSPAKRSRSCGAWSSNSGGPARRPRHSTRSRAEMAPDGWPTVPWGRMALGSVVSCCCGRRLGRGPSSVDMRQWSQPPTRHVLRMPSRR